MKAWYIVEASLLRRMHIITAPIFGMFSYCTTIGRVETSDFAIKTCVGTIKYNCIPNTLVICVLSNINTISSLCGIHRYTILQIPCSYEWLGKRRKKEGIQKSMNMNACPLTHIFLPEWAHDEYKQKIRAFISVDKENVCFKSRIYSHARLHASWWSAWKFSTVSTSNLVL